MPKPEAYTNIDANFSSDDPLYPKPFPVWSFIFTLRLEIVGPQAARLHGDIAAIDPRKHSSSEILNVDHRCLPYGVYHRNAS